MKKSLPNRKKTARITLRLDQDIKDKWFAYCKEHHSPINHFITNTVEGKLSYCESREIIRSIEGRSNDLYKVGNNINQIAKYVNTFNNLPNNQLERYNTLLKELNSIFIEHNGFLRRIYKELARDRK